MGVSENGGCPPILTIFWDLMWCLWSWIHYEFLHSSVFSLSLPNQCQGCVDLPCSEHQSMKKTPTFFSRGTCIFLSPLFCIFPIHVLWGFIYTPWWPWISMKWDDHDDHLTWHMARFRSCRNSRNSRNMLQLPIVLRNFQFNQHTHCSN